ncbi:hypothetical protein PVL30_003865 [Lodderomyces elongisporus]|uniref:uncharacterized protein n=1 Tax=Lodderomyces elongisporus TaxID=36914 RepID=UPI0029241DEC|nr:uncharacterized protein PVL30_003865 [Lodderomyces elongisporus]WLF80092.1 hypothetical protein PVL30_003865 [Lodderomyces elongisporus]
MDTINRDAKRKARIRGLGTRVVKASDLNLSSTLVSPNAASSREESEPPLPPPPPQKQHQQHQHQHQQRKPQENLNQHERSSKEHLLDSTAGQPSNQLIISADASGNQALNSANNLSNTDKCTIDEVKESNSNKHFHDPIDLTNSKVTKPNRDKNENKNKNQRRGKGRPKKFKPPGRPKVGEVSKKQNDPSLTRSQSEDHQHATAGESPAVEVRVGTESEPTKPIADLAKLNVVSTSHGLTTSTTNQTEVLQDKKQQVELDDSCGNASTAELRMEVLNALRRFFEYFTPKSSQDGVNHHKSFTLITEAIAELCDSSFENESYATDLSRIENKIVAIRKEIASTKSKIENVKEDVMKLNEILLGKGDAASSLTNLNNKGEVTAYFRAKLEEQKILVDHVKTLVDRIKQLRADALELESKLRDVSKI